jgi:peptidoglycan/xylan/chitin deacetylase (PgdA/CDA1 family)
MKFIFSICLFILSLFAQEIKSLNHIKEYKVLNKTVSFKNTYFTILRSFKIENKNFYLVIDNNSMKTSMIEKEKLIDTFELNSFYTSRYLKLVEKYTKPPYTLQNYGLKHISSKKIFLTIDMCPSSKIGYENNFFKDLSAYGKAVSITIFISGKWIKKHEDNFLELIDMQKKGLLDITWGNHTYNHFYIPNKKLEQNFLLIPNTNIEDEILETEKLLLSYGIVPSIFFRFPGLVSDEKSIKTVKKLGLIPVSSDSWIAKGEKLDKGSIVLLHGNRNEHKGIDLMNQLLKTFSFTIGSIEKEIQP